MGYPINVTNSTDMANAIPEVWAKELIIEAEKQMFWNSFEGPQGSGMPVIRKDDLTKEAGDQIHVQTMSNLTGSGQTGSNTLLGNEEKLSLGQITITPSRYRHAVGDDKDAEQDVNFDMRTIAKGRLAYWMSDKLDSLMFAQAVASRTYNQFAGDANNRASINSGDELDLTEVVKLHTQLMANLALPIQSGSSGEQLFCLVIHPYDAHYLQTDTSTLNWSNLQQYANNRGEMNPVFTGALGVLHGMIIKVSNNVPSVTEGANRISQMLAFGGEALAAGYSQYPDWAEETYDYGQQWGIGTSVKFGTANAVQRNIIKLEALSTAVTD